MAAVNKTISKDQEEEMSSALIAQLLAEDNMSHGNGNYYAEYSNDARGYDPYHAQQDIDDSYEENSEDDFDPKKKKYISKKDVAKRGRKRKATVATTPAPKLPKEVKTKPTGAPSPEPSTDSTATPGDTTATKATVTATATATAVKPPAAKKPKKPLGEGFNSGVYNELEEKNFLEGLELFGRDWGKLQRHVATRDSNSIRSHAQKHFIKMFRDQVPLPDKIRESGEGYTLSGKPLDPNSAAAKPYMRNLGNNGSSAPKKKTEPKKMDDPMQDVEMTSKVPMEKTDEISPMEVDKAAVDGEKTVMQAEQAPVQVEHTSMQIEHSSVQVQETPVSVQNTPVQVQETPLQEQKTPTNVQETPKNVQETPKNVQETPKNVQETPTNVQETSMDVDTKAVERQAKELVIGDDRKKTLITESSSAKSATPSPSNSSSTSDSYDSRGRTNYSTSRLRKQRDPSSVNYGQISNNDDPLTMIKCEPFMGKPGSNVNGCQPFEISVDSNVLLAMDFHAHLMTTEVIGFLAGKWDKETMRMSIREAFPCRSIETGQNDVNVEMDPTSAIETRGLIEERHLQVVGWYHSHPTFIPDPSLVDIENQRNYQLLCREDHHESMPHLPSSEPFVGAIVGPYDPALPGSASVINWFHVSNTNTDRPVPKKLIYELKENDALDPVEIERLFDLLSTYKDSREKVVFGEHWRQDASETKLQKMIKSLASRMPWIQRQLKSENNLDLDDMFLNKVQSSLKDW